MAHQRPTSKSSNIANKNHCNKSGKVGQPSFNHGYHPDIDEFKSKQSLNQEHQRQSKQFKLMPEYKTVKRPELEPQPAPAHLSREQLGRKCQTKKSTIASKVTKDKASVQLLNNESKVSRVPAEPNNAPVQSRHSRTKNHTNHTKIFFDKYLKFAYDLSKPEGVHQLEAHFFPNEPTGTNSKPKMNLTCRKEEPTKSNEAVWSK